MSRKLVTIQTIKELNSIPNADRIEVATILGWKCIVQKGEFKVDDKVIYFEVDSLLPVKPEFEFLRKSCYKEFPDGSKGFRIKTIRMKGQISQGLVLSLNSLAIYLPDDWKNLTEGTDITEILGVTLYQPPIPACLAGLVKGKFPSFIPKSDETRVQVLQDVLTRHKGTICYITEKIDGTSATFFIKDGAFGVCSRNLELLETPDNAFWKIARELKIEEKLRSLNKNIMIQGELCGHGLQDNPLKLEGKQIFFFNAFDIDKYKYYDMPDLTYLISILRLNLVPVIDTKFILTDNIEELVKLSIGKSLLNPKVQREGIVIRPLIEKIDLQMSQGMGNARVSFKAVNPEYLLEEKSK